MSTELRRRWSSGIAAVTVLLALGTGCQSPERATDGTPAAQPPTVSSDRSPTGSGSATAPPTASTAAPGLPQLQASFEELQATLAATVGVAIAPVGAGGNPIMLGEWTSGPAWSTIKVPLAIAAFRQVGSGASKYATPAITQSDNAAAEQLWEQLGTPAQAGPAVQAVLVETGDEITTVQQRKIRPEYSAFGQTEWSLAEQVRFTADLPCLPLAAPVVDLMGSIAADQQWGLGAVDGAKYKGGWGPGAVDGGYLVRQLGLITTPTGQIAISMAASPKSGTFEDGTDILTEIGQWLSKHVSELTPGNCA
ncbi:hypothetical protein ACHIPZ_16190 [Antrihabitans sp. NCIMB 15449]|uniref:Serine hydrolase n=1 Tax=Antrihabitans spumae TaxID=3373370 RepID=A0ABW7JP08_9NOCA